ncbi:MAG: hypothetical protein IKN38_04535 [Clostridia bacterium]|nr:hypothetical protein [Clostridia bacterium]
MRRTLSLILTLVVAVCIIPSCGISMTDEEARAIAAPLIEKSYEINELFFGKGIEADRTGAPYSADEDASYDVAPVQYYPAVPEKYFCTEDLKEAAKEVYTESYLSHVFDLAFEGMTSGDGRVIQYARYYDSVYSGLMVRDGLEDESILAGRVYDVSTLKVTSTAGQYVFFTVMSKIDGKDAGEVRLSIKDEGLGWRLDSPTY